MKTTSRPQVHKQIQRSQACQKTKWSQTLEVAAGQDHYKAHSEELVLEVTNVEAVLQAEGLADLQLVIRGKDQALINLRVASKDKV